MPFTTTPTTTAKKTTTAAAMVTVILEVVGGEVRASLLLLPLVKAIAIAIIILVAAMGSGGCGCGGGVDNDVGCLAMHFMSVTHLIAAVWSRYAAINAPAAAAAAGQRGIKPRHPDDCHSYTRAI